MSLIERMQVFTCATGHLTHARGCFIGIPGSGRRARNCRTRLNDCLHVALYVDAIGDRFNDRRRVLQTDIHLHIFPLVGRTMYDWAGHIMEMMIRLSFESQRVKIFSLACPKGLVFVNSHCWPVCMILILSPLSLEI